MNRLTHSRVSMLRLALAVALASAVACTSAYDTDDLRGDAGGSDAVDAGGGATDAGSGGDGGGQSDAAPLPDAAPMVDGAPAACGIVGDDCNEDPFLECTASGECEVCGGNGQSCCLSGAPCRNVGLVCALGSMECGIL